MKKQTLPLLLCCLVLLCATRSHANNLTITNFALTNINLGAGTMDVSFDIAWENSWRVSSGPANWDAAWVFVKYHAADGLWKHARLSVTDTDHFAPAGSTIRAGTTSGFGTGAFIHRAANGAGNASWTGVRLRWPFGAQGVTSTDLLTVSVMGIEMVYVPQGAFWVGDGFSTNRWQDGSSPNPFQIISEGTIILSATSGNLWAANGVISNALSGTAIPASFPKGFQAFYCMKYEVSNDQYNQYLYHTGKVTPPYSIPSRPSHPRAVVGYTSATPTAYQRANAQAVVYAYLDWSGLRPITEFEYEKACRGSAYPVAGDYAWGNSVVTLGNYTLTNASLPTEGISANYSTIAGNALWKAVFSYNPLRVGIFARSSYSGTTSPRIQSGASYCGIMEMTGNVSEPVLVVHKTATSTSQTIGLAFNGLHGDGDIITSPGWPVESVYGRGGGADFEFSLVYIEPVSNREEKNSSGIQEGFGYRGVRTAP